MTEWTYDLFEVLRFGNILKIKILNFPSMRSKMASFIILNNQ